eukprot:m51a1_g13257 hypothetical protein (126) ;mRNA; f:2003-2380
MRREGRESLRIATPTAASGSPPTLLSQLQRPRPPPAARPIPPDFASADVTMRADAPAFDYERYAAAAAERRLVDTPQADALVVTKVPRELETTRSTVPVRRPLTLLVSCVWSPFSKSRARALDGP